MERIYAKRYRTVSINEIDIIAEIKRMLPNYKADYLFYLYAPECLSYDPINNDFAELKEFSKGFPVTATERTAKQWLLDDTVQKAVRLLLAKVNVRQMNELHQRYVIKAQSDHFSLKALLELNKVMFGSSDDSELTKILNSIPESLEGEKNA